MRSTSHTLHQPDVAASAYHVVAALSQPSPQGFRLLKICFVNIVVGRAEYSYLHIRILLCANLPLSFEKVHRLSEKPYLCVQNDTNR